MAKIKIEENKLQLNQKAIQVTAKIKNTYNQLINYKNQAALLQKAFKNHTVLQKGEEIRFLNGESSLFLVNARENKTLETQLKLTEAVINYNKTNYSLLWSAGTLWLQ
jgi:outer membrane protein TolC